MKYPPVLVCEKDCFLFQSVAVHIQCIATNPLAKENHMFAFISRFFGAGDKVCIMVDLLLSTGVVKSGSLYQDACLEAGVDSQPLMTACGLPPLRTKKSSKP